jgi:hypothetical protein
VKKGFWAIDHRSFRKADKTRKTFTKETAMKRIQILRTFLLLSGLFTLFWWPLSHWFYSNWYHHLLGFQNYDPAFAKIIGTLGIFPVLGTLFAARDPVRNRDLIRILIVFCLLMAATYVFLITTMSFPVLEYINVGILIFSATILIILFPHVAANEDMLKSGQ